MVHLSESGKGLVCGLRFTMIICKSLLRGGKGGQVQDTATAGTQESPVLDGSTGMGPAEQLDPIMAAGPTPDAMLCNRTPGKASSHVQRTSCKSLLPHGIA